MNKDNFVKYLNEYQIKYNDDILKKLDIYANFLLEYNSHTNLTAIRNIEDIYLKHFLDSILLLVKFDIEKNAKILDIGTGAGFPGVILKIFRSDLDITLLDSNNKKITFLNELIKKLELNNIKAVNDRAENFIKNNREAFDYVTSRAVSSLNVLSELSIPFVKINGYFIPMKGNYEPELNDSLNAINVLGGELIKTIDYLLPVENSNRSIIVIKKNKSTETCYPRLYDKIKKKPL